MGRTGIRKGGEQLVETARLIAAKQRFAHSFPGSEAKVEVTPGGANLVAPPSRESVDKALASRVAAEQLSLLFVGKDWDRKGGELVVETQHGANRPASGIKTRLTIVGVAFDQAVEGVDVVNIPFLDQLQPRGLMSSTSRFWIAPTPRAKTDMSSC